MIIGDINVEGGEKVASSDPLSITFQKMDVTRSEDWKAILDLAVSKHGKVDILVNNAGTTYRNKVSHPLHQQGPWILNRQMTGY